MKSREDVSVLFVIPARGGSKGIPRKNLRSLGGRPLLAYAVDAANSSSIDGLVLVTSEDDEILSVAESLHATTHKRPLELAGDEVTLDAVVFDAYQAARANAGRSFDVVVTIQPTSPLVQPATVDRAIDMLLADNSLETVITATEDTHLRWTIQDGAFVPTYRSRVNRQLLPPSFRETGGVVATLSSVLRSSDRIGRRVGLLTVEASEALDIDGPHDWALAEWYLTRRDILFVVVGNHAVGLGHAQNALVVADALARHRVRFLVEAGSELAADLITARNYEVIRQGATELVDTVAALKPDAVINDRLDTSVSYMQGLRKASKVLVNFEDLGPGAQHADLVINAIYPETSSLPNHYSGAQFYVARPEFLVARSRPVRDRVESVLVTFGGTDPNDLTRRVLNCIQAIALDHGIGITVILGLGYRHAVPKAQGIQVHRSVGNMAARMREADLAFTSAGRTTFELATVGTPGIVIAQNRREATHGFASSAHGFVHLGLASRVLDQDIQRTFQALLMDAPARREMQRRMLQNDLTDGLDRVRKLIEGVLA